MGDDVSDTMNLDLNLGPRNEGGSGTGSISSEALNLDNWIYDPADTLRHAVGRLGTRQRLRLRQHQMPAQSLNLSVELNQLIGSSADGSGLQTGEGSVPPEDRTNETPKACENNHKFSESEVSEKKDDLGKGSGRDGSFFNCNICFDLSNDPVVTCCGHLFCWSCLYQWLHVHSDSKECPVCKGEVTVKNLTPIYGRVNVPCKPEEDLGLKIPVRPHARRVESSRQNFLRLPPMVQMIRQVQSTLESERGAPERATSLVDRFLRTRSHDEENPVSSPVDSGSTQRISTNLEGQTPRLPALRIRRLSRSHRASRISSLSSVLSSAERLVEGYLGGNSSRWNQEQPHTGSEDQDSFSSIGAEMNSESQMDNTTEIDSMATRPTTSRIRNDASFSNSTSRRRNDPPSFSGIDSADSPSLRRRRLS